MKNIFDIKEKEIVCPKHGKVTAKYAVFNGGTYGGCPLCAEEADEQEKAEAARKEQEAEIARLERMGIRERFQGCTLLSYTPQNESQRAALSKCRELIAGKIEKLVIFGGNGVGKTHLSCGVLREMGGRRYTAYEIICLLHECYSPKASKTELELVRELGNLPLLVIDELGATRGTQSEMSFLSAVIDERHNRIKPIMILTNKIRKSICPLYARGSGACAMCERQNCIERYLNNDALSRLSENGEKIDIVGDDFRRKNS